MPGAPSRYSSPWGAPSLLIQVTLWPAELVISSGAKAKSAIETFAPSAPAARASGARGAALTIAMKAAATAKSFNARGVIRFRGVISVSFHRRATLHDDFTRRGADRRRARRAARKIDDREI